MPDSDIQRLLGLEAGEIFSQFPLPLALVDNMGRAQVNVRFSAFFDHACLNSESLRGILNSNTHSWQPVRITRLDGTAADMYAQAIQVPRGNMLVLSECAAVMQDTELDHLRKRVADLEKISATDHLTGAWNRAHLVRVVASEIARSIRFRQPLSALLIDIDHFKQVNDTHGHLAGDAVLRELVSLIHQKIRSADLLFRWGGEEFVVLAVSTGYRDAQTLAEHLRARVAAHTFPAAGSLTISVGVAEHTGSEAADAWFSRLDAALYEAKEGGRNRVVTDCSGDSDAWLAGSASVLSLVWRDSYESGQPGIDAEHRELFDLANALIEAALPGRNRHADADAALTALLRHLENHFRHEEAILAEHGYARLAEHRQAHASLLRKAGELQNAAAAGTATFGALVDFLANDVVARHLFTADRDYFPLFRGDTT
jgi:diguanylate cyclase